MKFPVCTDHMVMQCNVIMTNLERRMQHKRLQGLYKNSRWYSQTEGKDM